MKHLRFLLMAALVAMPLTACDEDDETTVVEVPIIGTVSGTVSVEGAGLAGVSVTLVGISSQSATTGAGGTFTFANVEAGSYGVSISDVPADVSFSTSSKTTSITTQGQAVTVDFNGTYIRTAAIAGQVLGEGEGLAGVAVTASGPEGDVNAVTDGGGNYSFSGLRAGQYTISIDNIPSGFIFNTTSVEVTLGVGEASVVSFFGESEVDPVTAQVVISSVEDPDGDDIDPNDVEDQIQVALQIDRGENNLTDITLEFEDSQGNIIEAGKQTLGVGAGEQMADGIFTVVFTVVTDMIKEGAPVYLNDTWIMRAVLGLAGAVAPTTETSMTLVFDNEDEVLVTLMPEKTGVNDNGLLFGGGDMDVMIETFLFSGLELSGGDLRLYFHCGGGVPTAPGEAPPTEVLAPIASEMDVDGPFPTTVTFPQFDEDGDPVEWDDDGVAEYQSCEDLEDRAHFDPGPYTNGTVGYWNGNVNYDGPWGDEYFNHDNLGPVFDGSLILTDQEELVSEPDDIDGDFRPLACCSNNWAGPDYMPEDGMDGDLDDWYPGTEFEGIGGVVTTFHVGPVDDIEDEDDYPDFVADNVGVEVLSEAGLDQSLTNGELTILATFTDAFGNMSYAQLEGDGGTNPLETMGYDNTAPDDFEVVDGSHQNKIIYNQAKAAAAWLSGTGDLALSATEDRSGLGTYPMRGTMQWWDVEEDEWVYLIAQHDEDGGDVNVMSSTLVACAAATTPANEDECYPNYNSADGVYQTIFGLNNQAGLMTDPVDYWVFNDQEAPEVDNVGVPATVEVGEPMTVSAPVHDNQHLGCTAFSFDVNNLGVFYPFGENLCNADADPWDLVFPTDDVAIQTIDPAIVAVEFFPFGAVVGDPFEFTNVRATHTDLAGNQSTQAGNNFIAGTVEDGTSFEGTGLTNFEITEPSAAVLLCNGQGDDACDVDGDDGPEEVTSVDIEIVVEGPSGTLNNPFLPGKLFVYLRTGPPAALQFDLVGTLDASTATIIDEGVGGSRFYTWELTIDADDVDQYAVGENPWIFVAGVKNATGTALLTAVGNPNITVVEGT